MGFFFFSRGSIDHASLKALKDKINLALKSDCRVGCFTRDLVSATTNRRPDGKFNNPLNAIRERGHSRPTMWAHYADRYAGSCLIFHKDKLDHSVRAAAAIVGASVHEGDVVYDLSQDLKFGANDHFSIPADELRFSNTDEVIGRHITKYHLQLFFRKAPD